jgi:hypothetical protein
MKELDKIKNRIPKDWRKGQRKVVEIMIDTAFKEGMIHQMNLDMKEMKDGKGYKF